MNKFWDFIKDEATGERVLRLEGPIDEDSLWGDEITPDAFRNDLEAETGDVTVWLNSPGGNVFAAAQIYNMLRDHKGAITVKIDALAASAASVIAMAGDTVLMSPVSMLMIHDPSTIAMGNADDMQQAINTLNEVKASIVNAYHDKTGLSRNKISQLMSDETWLSARKAVDLGFADGLMFAENEKSGEPDRDPDDPNKDPDDPNKDPDEGSEGDNPDDPKKEDPENNWKPFGASISRQLVWAKLTKNAPSHSASASGIGVVNKKQPKKYKEAKDMTVEDLTKQYPDLVNAIADEASKKAVTDSDKAITDAVRAERDRIKEIEEIENRISDKDLVNKAKYETFIDAKTLAFEAMKAEADINKQALAGIDNDGKASGVSNVVPDPVKGTENETKEQEIKDGAALIAAALNN